MMQESSTEKDASENTKNDEVKKAIPSLPEWRSVQVAPRQNQLFGCSKPPSLKNEPATFEKGLKRPQRICGPNEMIDTSMYFAKASGSEDREIPGTETEQRSNWIPMKLRPVPAFYPLEKSSRLVEDELSAVAGRLSDCMRVLSVQAIYNNESATAYLITSENVEMHLSLWKTSGGKHPAGIVVELQRRKGDSIAFHRYSRFILDAAIDDFDAAEHIQKYGEDMSFAQSKKLQRLLNIGVCRDQTNEHENSIIAIEIAHSLLMKDRMDARQLGLESLCLLTDPRKTSVVTAVIASHVVLLGSASGLVTEGDDLMFDEAPFQEIREIILSLVQFSRIGEDEFGDEGHEDKFDERQYGTGEHMSLLHNLALAVLANSLDVIENEDRYDESPEETERKPPAVTKKSASAIAGDFIGETQDISETDILSTLIKELGKAQKKPHNAHLSAKCLGSLCRASEDAKNRAKELGAKNVISVALDVGVRTHLKLETECENVVKALASEGNNN